MTHIRKKHLALAGLLIGLGAPFALAVDNIPEKVVGQPQVSQPGAVPGGSNGHALPQPGANGAAAPDLGLPQSAIPAEALAPAPKLLAPAERAQETAQPEEKAVDAQGQAVIIKSNGNGALRAADASGTPALEVPSPFDTGVAHGINGEALVPTNGVNGQAQARAPPREILDEVLIAAERDGKISPDLKQALWEAGYLDPLTGLFNRRHLEDHLEDLVKRFPRFIMLKPDHLKRFNDRQGHDAGDRLLKGQAAIIKERLGDKGMAFVYRPGTFLVLLQDDGSDLVGFAEDLHDSVNQLVGAADVLAHDDPTPRKNLQDISGTLSSVHGELKAGPPGENAYSAHDNVLRQAKEKLERNTDSADKKKINQIQPAASVAQDEEADDFAPPVKPATGAELETKRSTTKRLIAQQNGAARGPAYKLLEQVKDEALRRTLARLIYLDSVTQLPNRRWLFDYLPLLFGEGGFTHYIGIDVDKLTVIKDQFGDAGTDQVLKSLGLILEEFTGQGQVEVGDLIKHDSVALRLAGDEFVILTRRPRAEEFADAVRLSVEERLGLASGLKDGQGKPLKITITGGVAEIEPDPAASGPQPMLTLVTATAEAMIRVGKANGRDRVEDAGRIAGVRRLRRMFRNDKTLLRAVELAWRRILRRELLDDINRKPEYALMKSIVRFLGQSSLKTDSAEDLQLWELRRFLDSRPYGLTKADRDAVAAMGEPSRIKPAYRKLRERLKPIIATPES